MFSLMQYTHGSIKFGKAKEAKKIKSKPFGITITILCMPITLSFPYYTMNNLVAKIRVDDICLDTCTFYDTGESLYDDRFSLDCHTHKLLIAIGYSESNNIVFGTPVMHRYPKHGQNYSVTLEVQYFGKIITYAKYLVFPNLDIRDITKEK